MGLCLSLFKYSQPLCLLLLTTLPVLRSIHSPTSFWSSTSLRQAGASLAPGEEEELLLELELLELLLVAS